MGFWSGWFGLGAGLCGRELVQQLGRQGSKDMSGQISGQISGQMGQNIRKYNDYKGNTTIYMQLDI